MKKILLSAALLSAAFGFSQQEIGEFPEMDGGMESQIADDTMSSAGSSQAGTPQTMWTVSSTSNSEIREIADDATFARSGNFFTSMQIAQPFINGDGELQTPNNLRLQSPSTTSPTLQTETEYTVQFHFRADSDPEGNLDPVIYLNNTNGSTGTNKTNATPFVADTWIKSYGTITTNTIFNASNWATVRINNTDYTKVSIDDFVVYAGAYDDVAPAAPTSTTGTYTTDGIVSWTAATGGVDGGGYVVVKYPASAAADTDINQNGIYQVGNSTAAGTIAYIGTGNTFSDTYIAGSEYKVFTADKAFNYSASLTLVDDTTLSTNSFTINGNKVTAYQPTSGTIAINGVEVDAANVYALNGAVVAKGAQTVDVSTLATGVYILQVESNGKSTAKTIVVQ